MKKTKAQSGITLIALVVTIVVLLILAGVTITYVLSDGGIFNTARRAGSETKIAAVRDYANNAFAGIMAEYYETGSDDNAGAMMEACFPAGAFETTPTVTCGSQKVTLTDTYTTTTEETSTVTSTSTREVERVTITMTKTTVTVSGERYDLEIKDSVITVTPATAE